ncbi:MAG TPA: hypothetical protein VJ183_01240 [Chloroflexia bacterium]|nr:hypothetical protein [Chloroflexia bacterium]
MKKWVFPILVILALIAFPQITLADSTITPPPGWSGSYKVVSPDGQYVLVMLDGVYTPPAENVSPGTEEQNRLLLKYQASGLYRNDGSNIPLWEMGYISWRARITLSSDGRHLIVWGEWPWKSGTYGELALAFYEDGRPIKMYAVKDLVSYPEYLPHSVSHYHWLLDYSFDDRQGLLTLETQNLEKHVFSISTGQIISTVILTATDEDRANKRREIVASARSTAISAEVHTPRAPLPPPQDYTVGLSLLLTGGSLGTLFVGVSFLSRNTRRKHQSNLHPGITPAHDSTTLRLKSRATGRKVTLRRPRANAGKHIQ